MSAARTRQRALCRLAHRPARGVQGAVGQDQQAADQRSAQPVRFGARQSGQLDRRRARADRPQPLHRRPRHAVRPLARRRIARLCRGQQRSAPMLLIPVTGHGGTVTSVELRNPWQRAWAQFRTSQSAIDYVRVSGLGVDPLLVNAARRGARAAAGGATSRPLRRGERAGRRGQADRLYPGRAGKALVHGRSAPTATGWAASS
jgi:hypothetical protein